MQRLRGEERRRGRETTHDDVGNLAKRLVFEVLRMLVLSGGEVDVDQLIGYVALFGY